MNKKQKVSWIYLIGSGANISRFASRYQTFCWNFQRIVKQSTIDGVNNLFTPIHAMLIKERKKENIKRYFKTKFVRTARKKCILSKHSKQTFPYLITNLLLICHLQNCLIRISITSGFLYYFLIHVGYLNKLNRGYFLNVLIFLQILQNFRN